jgi:UTP--glucose-1-phosphate uridylyltransferase
MRKMVKHHAMYGMKFTGKRYDIGNKMGFLKTNIEFGLEDPEIGESLKIWLKEFAKDL